MVETDEGAYFGVSQLDNISLGKLYPGSVGLLHGPSGTGKSSVLAHFLFKGAREDQNVCLITSEPPTSVASRMTAFKEYDPNWLRDGYISILNIFDLVDLIGVDIRDMEPGDTDLIYDLLVQTIDHLDARRVVIDPVNPLVDGLDRKGMIGFFHGIKHDLQRRNAFMMMSLDSDTELEFFEGGALSLYDLDVLIKFRKESEPPLFINTMTIDRWRSAPHKKTSYAIDISDEGVVLVPRIKPLEVR